jgi:hypothetical protein
MHTHNADPASRAGVVYRAYSFFIAALAKRKPVRGELVEP